MTCTKCGRVHTGICGIPPGVTRGFGARGIQGTPLAHHAKEATKRKESGMLEGLLRQGQEWHNQVTDMLKALPPEAEEYGQLLDRECKLNEMIKQVIGQLVLRRKE